jgi:hypothetical protein
MALLPLLYDALDGVLSSDCKCWNYDGGAIAEATAAAEEAKGHESGFESPGCLAGSADACARLGGGYGGSRRPSYLRKDSSWTLDALDDRTDWSPSRQKVLDSRDDTAGPQEDSLGIVSDNNDGGGTSSPDRTGKTTVDPSVATTTLVVGGGEDASIDRNDDDPTS